MLARGRIGWGADFLGDEDLKDEDSGGAPSGMVDAHAATPSIPFPTQSSARVLESLGWSSEGSRGKMRLSERSERAGDEGRDGWMGDWLMAWCRS